MTLTFGMVTIDSSNAATLGAWWRQLLEAEVIFESSDAGVIMTSDSVGLTLYVQQVPDPTPGKNRLHIDFQTNDRPAELDRLVGAGASHVETVALPEMAWSVFADPEGNRFCVTEHH